jgi:alkaline phosphatase D
MPQSDVIARRMQIHRRALLLSGLAAAGLPWRATAASTLVLRQAKAPVYPFALGVASGDPTANGVVLWTRLAPNPLEGGGMPAQNVDVRWVVAKDERLMQVVQQGVAVATPEWAHSVHVEVNGLEPDRGYFYAFYAMGEASPIGRTRTMPRPNYLPQKLRYAFASCQHYEAGLFTAYEHMAREELDLVFHLGDYIYEAAGRENPLRQHVGPLLETLSDYRNRHAQYKTDPHLQAAHARCPWVVTWDDHEFANNYAGVISENPTDDPEQFLIRRAQAYRAYYEHMPLRAASLPKGPHLKLYRNITFGRLAQFAVLDTRQYRTDQPCGDRNGPPCEGVFDPQATMLGSTQEAWLMDSLKRSSARWNVLAQQVMVAPIDQKEGDDVAISMDQWAGYAVPRTRLLSGLRDLKVSNPITIAGDIHSNWVNDLKVDFADPDSPTVATELVGTSITSGGNGSQVKPDAAVYAENPFLKFTNRERGYVSCTVTPTEHRADFQVVEEVRQPGAPLITRASYVVENGKPGAQRV